MTFVEIQRNDDTIAWKQSAQYLKAKFFTLAWKLINDAMLACQINKKRYNIDKKINSKK